MTRSARISTAHRLACDAVDLAREHADNRVLEQLRSATIHLWYALNSSETSERLDAAERQLTAALEDADDEISPTLRTALDHLRGHSGAGRRLVGGRRPSLFDFGVSLFQESCSSNRITSVSIRQTI